MKKKRIKLLPGYLILERETKGYKLYTKAIVMQPVRKGVTGTKETARHVANSEVNM